MFFMKDTDINECRMCAEGEVVTHTQVIREWIKSLQSLLPPEFHSFSAHEFPKTITEWT